MRRWRQRRPREITCARIVELVTGYLEGALDPATAARVDLHLLSCPGCVAYLDQMRHTIRALGRVEPAQLSPEVRDELLAAFRGWREEPEP
jgi:predicted anti-sigma-YlaC factor YlaD